MQDFIKTNILAIFRSIEHEMQSPVSTRNVDDWQSTMDDGYWMTTKVYLEYFMLRWAKRMITNENFCTFVNRQHPTTKAYLHYFVMRQIRCTIASTNAPLCPSLKIPPNYSYTQRMITKGKRTRKYKLTIQYPLYKTLLPKNNSQYVTILLFS